MQVSAFNHILQKLFNREVGFKACFTVSLTLACWWVLWILL